MWEKIKKLFITEIPKLDDVSLDQKTNAILSDIEWLIANKDLETILNNEVVRIYILKVWFVNSSQLYIHDAGEFISKKSLVYTGDYFEGHSNNIYYFFKQMHYKIKNKVLSKKQVEDVVTVVKMFKFYIGD